MNNIKLPQQQTQQSSPPLDNRGPATPMNNGSTNTNFINNMNAAPQVVPTSSNNIFGSADPAGYTTPTTNTHVPYTPVQAPAPANPADLVQIPLKLAPGKKKSNIAKFLTPNNTPMEFSTMAHPIKMCRAPEVSEPEPVAPPKENPFFKKKSSMYEKKPIVKDPKAVSKAWHTRYT